MTILPIAATTFSALPSCDPRRSYRSCSSALFRNLASYGGRKTNLRFSKGDPMSFSMISPSTRASRLVTSSQKHGDGTYSEKMGHISSRSIVKAQLDSSPERETPGTSDVVTPDVAIIMGSDSDLPIMKDAVEILEYFGVPHEVTIISTDSTPERLYSFALSAKERGIKIIIAGAGGVAHLPDKIASLTTLPVFGVPIRSSSSNGLDSLLSTVQMPKGIPVATVGIENAANAALLAVWTLAAEDTDLLDRVNKYQNQLMEVAKPEAEGWVKIPAGIMYHILGEDEGETGFHFVHQLIAKALHLLGASVYWFNKLEIWKQLKMGHTTIVSSLKCIVKGLLDSLLERETPGTTEVVTPRVAIIMGSRSDLPTMKDAIDVLEYFGVPHEVTIVSAHRNPQRMYSFALSARERGIKVIIAGAGGAAHLPGMVASLTGLPVLGVPIRTSSLDGLDSLLSIVQMPKGVPVGTFPIGEAANPALEAVRILSIADADLSDRVSKYDNEMKDTILAKGWEAYLSG